MTQGSSTAIPATLFDPSAKRFWAALLLTGAATGLGAGFLTRLLEAVQARVWGEPTNVLHAAQQASGVRCFGALLGAGLVTALGQLLLKRLSSGNGIDTTAAIWFHAGRLPALRTLGSAILSVVVVGMGASLGREGAPKQFGAVFGNLWSSASRLSDEQRRLLVACGAGAGMAAAYGVPLGGALFALEVMRGVLALRYILPALFCSIVATAVAWTMLPDAPTYLIPAYASSASLLPWIVVCGVIAGFYSVAYVRAIAWAERSRPAGWKRMAAPVLGLGLLGLAATRFPHLLGNGRDTSQLLFTVGLPLGLAAALAVLKPAAVVLCIGSGVPGGLFTPSLTCGALLGALIGNGVAALVPGASVPLFSFLGAGAVLAATTQGPISTVVLLMELTGRDRSLILPLLLACAVATLVARSVEPRSVYDAKLTDEEVAKRQKLRRLSQIAPDHADEA